MNFDPMLKTAIEIKAIQAILAEAPIGGIITYETLSREVGFDVKEKRYVLMRAIENLNRESGAIFASIWKVGQMRLPPQDTHLVGANARARIKRKAAKAGRFMMRAVCAANDMPREAALAANREIAMCALIEFAASEKAQKAAATEDTKPKPTAEVLRDMLKNV